MKQPYEVAIQLMAALVSLIETTDELPVRSNAPRRIMNPYVTARTDAYELLHQIVGGEFNNRTLAEAKEYLLRHAQPITLEEELDRR